MNVDNPMLVEISPQPLQRSYAAFCPGDDSAGFVGWSSAQVLDSDARFDLIDNRFQLAVVPFSLGTDPVWAYFPVHRRRRIANRIEIRPETRVLLVIFEPDVERLPYEQTMNKLRHHIGHVLRYLRGPKLKNDCSDAETEWKKSRR